jgi:hypothetical protein
MWAIITNNFGGKNCCFFLITLDYTSGYLMGEKNRLEKKHYFKHDFYMSGIEFFFYFLKSSFFHIENDHWSFGHHTSGLVSIKTGIPSTMWRQCVHCGAVGSVATWWPNVLINNFPLVTPVPHVTGHVLLLYKCYNMWNLLLSHSKSKK